MGVIISIFIFTFVVFVHEFGHFIVGKKLGAEPTVFSIGFGKSIWSKTISGVQWKIGMIPFGGYVRFAKDCNNQDPKLKVSHWKNIIISLAGPISNLILSYSMTVAFVLFSFYSTTHHVDKLEKILGNKVSTNYSESVPRVIIGSFAITNDLIILGAEQLVKELKGSSASSFLNNASGPVGITNEINKDFKTGGNANLFLFCYLFIAMVSASIGLTNLIPFGVLDGGRVLSSLLKMITRENKFVTPVLNFFDLLSIISLVILIVGITTKDIFNLF